MPEAARIDQAAGLRRMLGKTGLRAITVMSGTPGAGKTVASVNLASALARSGSDVLLIDPSVPGQVSRGQGVAARLGLNPARTLADPRGADIDALVLEHEVGVRVLPLGGGFERFSNCPDAERARLEAGFAGLARAVDTVLIDTESGHDPARLPLGLARADILIVVTPDATSIKDGYALIKQLAQRFGKRQFQLLVNRADKAGQADTVAANLTSAAARFLDVRIECVGAIPDDLRIRDADVLRQSVVAAFPVAASAPHFRRLAERLTAHAADSGVANLSVLMQRVLEGSRLLGTHGRG